MNEVVQFLKDCRTFYIATVDGDQPRVRPFGAVLEHDGKIYFCTGNGKDFYKQCMKNPKTEICACSASGQWIRLAGSTVYENNLDVKKEFFANSPSFESLYKSPDGPTFEVFYLKDAVATIYSFGGAPKVIKL